MPQLTVIEKRLKLNRIDSVRFQIMTYCFQKNIKITDADLKWLALLSVAGRQKLNEFCYEVCNKDDRKDDKMIKESAQTVRNSLNKCEKLELLVSEGKNKKVIYVNPIMKVQADGPTMLDYKFITLDTEESKKPASHIGN